LGALKLLQLRERFVAALDAARHKQPIIHGAIAALELKKDYDVVVVDLNMPVFDGERLLAYWSLTCNDEEPDDSWPLSARPSDFRTPM